MVGKNGRKTKKYGDPDGKSAALPLVCYRCERGKRA